MKQIIHTGFIIGLFTILIGDFTVEAQQVILSVKEMTVEVQPNIIALPKGGQGEDIPRFPIRAARVRSTELRDLNKQYNAISIERIFEVTDSTDSLSRQKVLRKSAQGYFELGSSSNKTNGLASEGKFLKLKKKETTSGDETKLIGTEHGIREDDITIVNDFYIIAFRDYKDSTGNVIAIDLDETVTAYAALPVVISAKKTK